MPDDRRIGDRRDPERKDFRTHPFLDRRNRWSAALLGKQAADRRKTQTPEWIRRAQGGNLPINENQRGK